MAFDVSALSAYIENSDFPLVSKLQFDPELRASRATIQDGVKGSSNIHIMESDVVFQADDCTRTGSGTTTLTDKTVTVGKVSINEDLCLTNLEGKWAQTLLRKGVQEGREIMPEEIAEVLMAEKMVKYKQAIAVADWQGNTSTGTGNNALYNGWIAAIDAGSPIAGNTGSVASVTVSNILDVLDAMILERPAALRGREDVCLDMPQEYYDMYIVALKNANLYHYAAQEGDSYLYGTNIKINPDFGLNGTNRMFLTFEQNLVVALDSESDGEFDMRLHPVNKKVILLDSNFKRGCQVMYDDLVVEFSL